MKEINDCLSLPLIALDTSEEIGVLTHFITDPVENRIIGFALTTGEWFTERKAILFPDVSAFGVDAVIVRAANAVRPITEVSEIHEYIKEDREKRVRQAISASGQSLGTLTDWAFDERSAEVERYRLERPDDGEVVWVNRDSFVRSGRAVVIIDSTDLPLNGGSTEPSGGGSGAPYGGGSSTATGGGTSGGATAGTGAGGGPSAAYAAPATTAPSATSPSAVTAPTWEAPPRREEPATASYAPSAPATEPAPDTADASPSAGLTDSYTETEPEAVEEDEAPPAPLHTEEPSYQPVPEAEELEEPAVASMASDVSEAPEPVAEEEEEETEEVIDTIPMGTMAEPVYTPVIPPAEEEEIPEAATEPATEEYSPAEPLAEPETYAQTQTATPEEMDEEFELSHPIGAGGNGTAVEAPEASTTVYEPSSVEEEEEELPATTGFGAAVITETYSVTPTVEEQPEEEAALEETTEELPEEAPAMAAASAAPQAEPPVAEQLKEAINRNKEGIIPFVVGKYSDREIVDDEGRRIVSQGQQITLEIASSASRAWKLYDLWIAAQSSPSGED